MLSSRLSISAPASGMSSVQKCNFHGVLMTWQHWGHFQRGTELETLPASEQTRLLFYGWTRDHPSLICCWAFS